MPRHRTALARLLLPQGGRPRVPNPGLRSLFSSSLPSSSLDNTAAVLARLDSWTLTLERGIGRAYGAEGELQATGAFRAEVFPDLPIATTWLNLAKALSGSLGSSWSSSSTASASTAGESAPPFTHYTTRPGALKVITAAANVRSEREIEERIVAAAGDGAEAGGGQRANVLLCVSGSHPMRTLPLVPRFLRSSLDTLVLAGRLRRRGYIPPATQLWVVANPNTERGAALLEAKASLGATAVLTQPPLDWPAYLAWLDDAERRGLLRPAAPPAPPPPPPTTASAPLVAPAMFPAGPGRHSSIVLNPTTPGAPVPLQRGRHLAARNPASTAPTATTTTIISNNSDTHRCGDGGGSSSGAGAAGGAPLSLLVGHPMLSSAANLSFWISLSGCGDSGAARSLLAEAARAELAGREAADAHFEAYNRRLVAQVLERGGLAGLHVMPITKAAKRAVLGMLRDGSLPPSS